MNKKMILTAVFGILANFILFAVKLYIGISSNVLCIYCDAVNNLGDCLSCIIALIGFILILKLNETKGKRAEALAGFVIGIIVAVTGAVCAYNGLERTVYPVLTSFSFRYAVLISITAIVKLLMAAVYIAVNKKSPSPVLKTMILDCFLDFAITIISLTGFYLIEKINFPADGLFGIIIGVIIFVSASKTVFEQAKFIINN